MREPELLASASCPSCTSDAPAPLPHSTHKEHLVRLRRIEGQVRGIAKMVEEEQYCLDILNQIRAAKAALSAVESRVLAKHLKHCLQAAFASGDDQTIDRKVQELVELSVRAGGR